MQPSSCSPSPRLLTEQSLLSLPGHQTCPCFHISFPAFHKTFDNIFYSVLSKVPPSFSSHFKRNRRYINHLSRLNDLVSVLPPFFWLERSPHVAQDQASQGFSRFSCSSTEATFFIKVLTVACLLCLPIFKPDGHHGAPLFHEFHGPSLLPPKTFLSGPE